MFHEQPSPIFRLLGVCLLFTDNSSNTGLSYSWNSAEPQQFFWVPRQYNFVNHFFTIPAATGMFARR